MKLTGLCAGGLVGALTWLSPLPVFAHITLLSPPPRHAGQENKSCPCGQGQSNRVCDVARDGSDPNRSTTVSTFGAGSTITVRFEEYVDHAGRFRVAFDPNGADVADFNAHVLLDVPDPGGVTSNTSEAGIWQFDVTLPDTPCDNCTLQLIQAMHGDTETPVSDPSSLSTYYTCADITLVDPASTGATVSSTTNSGSSTTSSQSATSAGADNEDETGCACRLGKATTGAAGGWAAAWLLALGSWRRRARR